MNQRTPRSRWPSVRLVVLFVLCIQIPDVFSETLRFNWPRPGRATVVETTEASGISLASRYDIAVQARSGKDGYVLHVENLQRRVAGSDPTGRDNDALAEPRFAQAFSTWPSYLISETGQIEGFMGLETFSDKVAGMTEGSEVSRPAKDFAKSAHFPQAVRDQLATFWQGLIGCLHGLSLEAGDTLTRQDTFSWYGSSVPVEIAITHQGPASDVAGAVRLETSIAFDEAVLKEMMSEIVAELRATENTGALQIERVQRKMTFDSVMSPGSLIPHHAHVVDQILITTDQTETLRLYQAQALEFDWDHDSKLHER